MATKKKTGRAAAAKGKARAKVTAPRKAAAKKAAAPRRKAAAKSGALSISAVAPGMTVNDIGRSLAYYQGVLGFAVKERWEDGGVLRGVELSAGPSSFMLGQDDWKKGRDRVKGEAFRIYCETDQDIDRLAAKIKASGGTLTQEPTDEWGMRTLSVEDPDGFKITIGRQQKKKR